MSRRRYLAIIPAAALLLAGCGSDSGGGGGGSGGSSKPATKVSGPAGTPIVLGNIGSYSGANSSSLGRVPDVVNAWVNTVNAGGGINGHPVKMFIEDDAGDPTKALQAVKKLVETDKVQAIVGQYSVVETSFASYIDKAGIPMVGGQPNNKEWFTDPNFFPSGSNVVTALAAQFDVMKKQGKKKFGLMYCAEAPVCAQLDGLVRGLVKLFPGIEVSYTGKVAATSPNYDAQCLAAKNAGVDTLMVAGNSAIDLKVTENCDQIGLDATPINTAVSAATTWLKSDSMNNMDLVAPDANYDDTSVPGVAAFRKAIDKYYPDLPDSDQYSQATILTWAGGKLYEAAAAKAKLGPSSTGADVKRGLYALKDETLNGISAPLNYVKGKPTFLSCYFTQQIKDGKFVSLNGGKPTCLSSTVVAGLAKVLGG